MKMICVWALLCGACMSSNAQAQTAYSYSTSGDEVRDARTGLVWRRCSEGLSWDGTNCDGSVSTFTHQAALTLAQGQTGWRLPNAQELASIANRSKFNPAIDTIAFPDTPTGNFWSSTPFVGLPESAWYVDFFFGLVNRGTRSSALYVRLVR